MLLSSLRSYGADYGLWAWGNQEQQYYKTSNVKVAGGQLALTALREETVLDDGYTFKYSSGRITTKGKLGVFGGMRTADGRKWDTVRIEAALQAPLPSERSGRGLGAPGCRVCAALWLGAPLETAAPRCRPSTALR
jgi:hypothetical protein